jgi:CRISPR-associated protein Csd1
VPGRSGKKAYEKAYFLCDDSEFMLGLDSRKFESAKKRHIELLADIDTPSAHAITSYFNTGTPSYTTNLNKENIIDSYTFKLKSSDITIRAKDMLSAKFVFMVNGKRVDYNDGDDKIISAWEYEYAHMSDNDMGLCLVTGKCEPIARLHSEVNLKGVTMGGQALISMNTQTSFRSYGSVPKDPPALIGEKTNFAYTTALNNMLSDPNHYQFIAKDTLVYWAEGKGEAEVEIFNILSEPKESEDELLSAIMRQIAQGKLPEIDGYEWEKPFYLLCLSPNAARISVRFFNISAFGEIIKNLTEHYQRLDIVRSPNGKYPLIPLWMILKETTVSNEMAEVSPLLGGQLMQCILKNTSYPMDLYYSILNRVRAGKEITRTKAAIIKAVLVKNFNEREVTSVSLNPTSNDRAYILGRLFFVLEQLQKEASGGSLNTTIRERYFASSCANPQSVFPTILRLSMHHAAKLDNAVRYEKLKTELLGYLDEVMPFPATLNLEKQGKFILGYYHQAKDFFTKKEKE